MADFGLGQEYYKLADELARMHGRLDLLEEQARASQLKFTSVDGGGTVAFFDQAGLERLRLGLQPDGSFTSDSKNNPDPPPVPRPPLLTAGKGTVKIQSQGSLLSTGAWPKDFSHLKVYAAVEGEVGQYVGAIARDPGVFVLGPLPYKAVTVWFTAVNHSKKESEASQSTTVTPEKVVGDDILDGTIAALQLADEAVERAKIAVGAIDASKLDDGAVTYNHIAIRSIDGEQIRTQTLTALNLVARTITGLQLEVQSILGENIAARTIAGEHLQALSITANEIAANAITAAKLTVGAVTADSLEAVLVLATEIIAGDPTGARVAISYNGVDAFNMAGERTFQLDAQTGDVRLTGIVETGKDGSLVRITPGDPNYPIQTPGAYFYADNSDFPALIYASPDGNATGVRPTALTIIASLDDTAAAGNLGVTDYGAVLSYGRLITSPLGIPLVTPQGGHITAHADGATMHTITANNEVQEGPLPIDGGYASVGRTGAVLGIAKNGADSYIGFFTVNGGVGIGQLFVEGAFATDFIGDQGRGLYLHSNRIVSAGAAWNNTYGATAQMPRAYQVTIERDVAGTVLTAHVEAATATGVAVRSSTATAPWTFHLASMLLANPIVSR